MSHIFSGEPKETKITYINKYDRKSVSRNELLITIHSENVENV